MKATKGQLINFLEKRVFTPAENAPATTDLIKKKVRTTRMRLNGLKTAEQVEHFFWSAMATDHGIDTYTKLKIAGLSSFEDVRADFKALCGR